MKNPIAIAIAPLVLAAAAWAQPPQPTQPPVPAQAPGPPQRPGPPQQPAMAAPPAPGNFQPRMAYGTPPPPPRPSRPPMERSMPGGRWWSNPDMVQRLNLNSDQQKKMDDIFLQNRLRLVDLNATLQKEEITMEPLMAADSPEESRILTQIDKVAQARAELEKANARFLLGIRRVLTQDQWKKLQSENPPGMRTPTPAARPTGEPGMPGPGPNGPPPARKKA